MKCQRNHNQIDCVCCVLTTKRNERRGRLYTFASSGSNKLPASLLTTLYWIYLLAIDGVLCHWLWRALFTTGRLKLINAPCRRLYTHTHAHSRSWKSINQSAVHKSFYSSQHHSVGSYVHRLAFIWLVLMPKLRSLLTRWLRMVLCDRF